MNDKRTWEELKQENEALKRLWRKERNQNSRANAVAYAVVYLFGAGVAYLAAVVNMKMYGRLY